MSAVLRLTLVSHAATEAIRLASFPDNESLNEVGKRECATFLPLMADRVMHAPEQRAAETAAGIGLSTAVEEPLLRDLDLGRWRGMSLDTIESADLTAWLTDPAAAPHGGESVAALIARVQDWQTTLTTSTESVVAVTHPAVIRAMILIALDAPPQSFWRIDVPPLAITRLHHRGSWTLRSTGL